MDYMSLADRAWPVLRRVMDGHARVSTVQVGSERRRVRARVAKPSERTA